MTEETELPPPLVPADVDLRAYAFTPMFRARLFGSSFHARATDAEWRAGVTLWLKSWDQVPAGTLPDDDIDLCRLAEFGRDLRTWRKVKERALHGWFKTLDGRLHHEVVAEGVLEAWDGRRKASTKGKAGAEKRWGGKDATANTAANATGNLFEGKEMAGALPGDSNREGEGQGKGKVPRATDAALEAEFDQWYAIYPLHVGRGAALKAFKKARQSASLEALIAGAQRYREDPARKPDYTAHPSTWLNQERWQDETDPAPGGGGGASSPARERYLEAYRHWDSEGRQGAPPRIETFEKSIEQGAA
jgi:hypothetical protein